MIKKLKSNRRIAKIEFGENFVRVIVEIVKGELEKRKEKEMDSDEVRKKRMKKEMKVKNYFRCI